jgi:ribose 5-phosphate isomerase B
MLYDIFVQRNGDTMKIAIDSDSNGLELKRVLCEFLQDKGIEFSDLSYLDSNQVDYPDIGYNLAGKIQKGEFDRGILICGTGLGMAMCANKVPGVYAGAAHDVYSAERLIKSNDAHIICLGAQVVGPQLALILIKSWLESEFQGGRSAPKVERMRQLEKEHAEDSDR